VTNRRYIPNRGDIVWVDFDPSSGHEQAGKRPAIILSEHPFNKIIGLALVAPITSRVRGHGFEVTLSGKNISGVVLCQQVKTMDYDERRLSYIEKAPLNVINEVLKKVRAIVN